MDRNRDSSSLKARTQIVKKPVAMKVYKLLDYWPLTGIVFPVDLPAHLPYQQPMINDSPALHFSSLTVMKMVQLPELGIVSCSKKKKKKERRMEEKEEKKNTYQDRSTPFWKQCWQCHQKDNIVAF